MNQKRWIGLILIGIGILVILGNLGVLENFWGLFGTYWPVLLIIAGLFNVVNNPAGKIGGFIVFIGGVLLLLNNLDQVQIFTHITFWPIVLILVGIWFVFKGGQKVNVINKDSINSIAFFSGNSSKIVSQDFKGGSTVSIFGGSNIDLREAKISGVEAKFDIFAMFGGAEIHVPEDWQLMVKGLPLFGGLDDKTNPSPSEGDYERPTLVVHYLVLFGGVELMN